MTISGPRPASSPPIDSATEPVGKTLLDGGGDGPNAHTGPAGAHGWMPHHGGGTPVHSAAHWLTSMHRALPHVAMGLRTGGLIPPRGTLVHAHANPHAKGASAHGAHGGPSSHKAGGSESHRVKAGGQGDNGGADGIEGDGDLLEAGLPRRVVSGGASGDGDSGGTGAGDSERDSMSLLNAAADEVREGDFLDSDGNPLRAATSAQSIQTPAEVDARLRQGELVWANSLRLAMQCAQMHPGADVFVQAFNVIDAEGHIVSAFGRRGRLRSSDGGVVHAYREAAPNSGTAAPDAALMSELESASLLALSMRPVLDEAGRPASSLLDVPFTELSQLRSLFERPLPPGLRNQIVNAAQIEAQRWREACARADFEAGMAMRGDVMERELNEQRARLSTTIAGQQTDAHRARINWLRTQEQVRHWAQAGRQPTWVLVAQINRMLGEGLVPWNRPRQAERVGARYGELRTVDVVCGVPPQYFLRADQLPQAVIELFDWYEEQQRFATPVVIVAAQLLQRLITLHPFADANGRTARLAADWVLQLQGLPPPALSAGNLALFPNEADHAQPPPGAVERNMLQGLRSSVDLHLQWLPPPADFASEEPAPPPPPPLQEEE
jgi:hypothetical protein